MTKDSAETVARLQRLIPKLRGKRIAVLGDLMLDRYLWGTATRLSPEAAVPVVNFVEQQECLGGAANVAANLVALGAKVEMFGVVGASKNDDDEAGRALRAGLRTAGISDRGVIADAARITTVKTRIIATNQHIVRVDRERSDLLSRETEDKVFRRFAEAAKKLDGLVLSDYDKGVITDSLSERVMRLCHKEKVPVFVSPKKRRLFAHRGARLVACNRQEATDFVNHELRDRRSIEDAGRALLAHFGCSAVVITRGGEGMSVFEEESPRHLELAAVGSVESEPRHSPIPAIGFDVTYARVGQRGVEREMAGRQVFDRTGAGDTVLSVLSLAVAAGASVPDAAMLANTAAFVVVGKLGTATVSPQELAHALNEVSSR